MPDAVIRFDLPVSLKEAARRAAEARDQTLAAFIRTCLREREEVKQEMGESK